jgi:hypothetical protein
VRLRRGFSYGRRGVSVLLVSSLSERKKVGNRRRGGRDMKKGVKREAKRKRYVWAGFVEERKLQGNSSK